MTDQNPSGLEALQGLMGVGLPETAVVREPQIDA